MIQSKQTVNKSDSPAILIGDHSTQELRCDDGLEVTMEIQVHNVCRDSWYQLYNIAKLRQYMDRSSLECLIHILCHHNYCNSLFFGIGQPLTAKRQRIHVEHCSTYTHWPQ